MSTILKSWILLLVSFGGATSWAQQQPVIADTVHGLPQLEIPEITIVGKKPITLPFARKGEIYDVNVYEAPAPDSTILEQRPAISLPIGSLPRYDEPLVPWHISAEGSLGSYSTVNGCAYVDYKGKLWGIDGKTGFSTTQGHTDNASGNAFDLEGNARSIISTDNDILKSFRLLLGTKIRHDSYGIYGIHDTSTDRSRTNVLFDASIASTEHTFNDIGVRLSANIWLVGDTRNGKDSSISAVSPTLDLSYGTNIQSVRFTSSLAFIGSSLNYDHSIQSPSLVNFDAGAEWQLKQDWLINVGATIENGSGSVGGSRSLIAPFGIIRWLLDADREVRFWFRPEMRLETYGDEIRSNPYLVREIALRPERMPVSFGGSFWFNSELFSVEVRGSFEDGSDVPITLADSVGRIRLDFVDASRFVAEAVGTVKPTERTRVQFSGTIQPAFESGTSTQLPMIPLLELEGRGELNFSDPFNLWSSVKYMSKRNVDRAGSNSLGDNFTVGVGGSTSIIPKTVLSLQVLNLFNTAYSWWYGYVAPGRTIMLNARVNIQ